MISVPHSGTRTLVEHLGVYATQQGFSLWGAGEWWHFGGHYQSRVNKTKIFAHIPIRHPLDVAASWARRMREGKVLEDLINRYHLMFDYLLDPERNYQLHRVEDLPRLQGKNEHAQGERKHKVKRYQEEVKLQVIEPYRDFFECYYKDLDRGFELV